MGKLRVDDDDHSLFDTSTAVHQRMDKKSKVFFPSSTYMTGVNDNNNRNLQQVPAAETAKPSTGLFAKFTGSRKPLASSSAEVGDSRRSVTPPVRPRPLTPSGERDAHASRGSLQSVQPMETLQLAFLDLQNDVKALRSHLASLQKDHEELKENVKRSSSVGAKHPQLPAELANPGMNKSLPFEQIGTTPDLHPALADQSPRSQPATNKPLPVEQVITPRDLHTPSHDQSPRSQPSTNIPLPVERVDTSRDLHPPFTEESPRSQPRSERLGRGGHWSEVVSVFQSCGLGDETDLQRPRISHRQQRALAPHAAPTAGTSIPVSRGPTVPDAGAPVQQTPPPPSTNSTLLKTVPASQEGSVLPSTQSRSPRGLPMVVAAGSNFGWPSSAEAATEPSLASQRNALQAPVRSYLHGDNGRTHSLHINVSDHSEHLSGFGKQSAHDLDSTGSAPGFGARVLDSIGAHNGSMRPPSMADSHVSTRPTAAVSKHAKIDLPFPDVDSDGESDIGHNNHFVVH